MPDTLAEDTFGFENSGAAPASFVVSVSGLTANPTYGETAEIGARLYACAHHFSAAAPATVTWQWRNSRGDIAGATGAAYVPVAGDNLQALHPVATPLGAYAPRAGPAYLVRFSAPVATGVLPDVSYAGDTGEKIVATADVFSGEYLTYSADTALHGVRIDRGTGVMTVPTASQVDGAITVIATNSGGAAQVSFNVSITGTATVPARMGAPTVTATGPGSLRVALAGAPQDGGSPITSYDLRWRQDGGTWTVLADMSDPETLSGLLAETGYTVQTSAVNAMGRGPWSDGGVATTEAGTDPLPSIAANAGNTVDISVADGMFTLAITGADLAHHNGTFGPFATAALASGPLMVAAPAISGTAGTGETLSAAPGLWIFPTDDAPAIAGEWISGGTGTGDTDAGYVTGAGDEGGDVLYRETATNTAGSRNADSNAIGIPVSATVPAQMGAPTVTATGPGSLRVERAAAPSDGGSAVTSYDLRWRQEGGAWTTVTGIGDPQALGGLTASTRYDIRTRAVNAVGAGPWSASGSTMTDAAAAGFVDDFTGYTDGDRLESSPDWTTETSVSSHVEVADGLAFLPAIEGNTANSLICDAALASDHFAEVTFDDPGAGPGAILTLYARMTDSGNCYALRVQAGKVKEIRKIIEGLETDLAPRTNMAIPPGGVLRLEVSGTTGVSVVVTLNGNILHDLTDTGTMPSGSHTGLGFERLSDFTTTNLTVDSFSCGDL